MKKTLLILPLTLIMLFVLAVPVLAQGPNGDGSRVLFGQNLTLQAEETIRGDVVVFGGNLNAMEGSTIEGDVVIFGGNATINGTAESNVVVMGGNVNINDTAVVEGDIVYIGANANISEGAVVEGNVVNPFAGDFQGDFSSDFSHEFDSPGVSSGISGAANRAFDFVGDIVRSIAMLIGLAAVSWLVATFMPAHMKEVGDTIASAGPASFGMGFLTVIISLVVGLPLLITVCLAFIPIGAWIAIGIATLFGWLVVGQIIGERLLIAAGQIQPNFVLSTVVGTLVLTIVVNMPVLSWIPCIGFIFGLVGWLIGFVVGHTALGAVILTRFGTRPYTTQTRPPYSPPPTGPRYTAANVDDVDVNSASEAELRAKIKAALAEEPEEEPQPPQADEPDVDPEPEPEPDDAPPDSPPDDEGDTK